uniref:Uncharacterized protein n=1 Tax=Arion vulgaris TaxID=1028688 RepID=A0A0B6Z5B9_9EUPU
MYGKPPGVAIILTHYGWQATWCAYYLNSLCMANHLVWLLSELIMDGKPPGVASQCHT